MPLLIPLPFQNTTLHSVATLSFRHHSVALTSRYTAVLPRSRWASWAGSEARREERGGEGLREARQARKRWVTWHDKGDSYKEKDNREGEEGGGAWATVEQNAARPAPFTTDSPYSHAMSRTAATAHSNLMRNHTQAARQHSLSLSLPPSLSLSLSLSPCSCSPSKTGSTPSIARAPAV